MAEQITVFGQVVTLDAIKIGVTAINNGFTVTAQAVLDGDDVLMAHTVARPHATVSEVTDQMVPEAVSAVREWITAHAAAPDQPVMGGA